mmetsp:Transcript_37933/g.49826  ORF Transcript_37933/g.49826 Transcript_37933/m.49826 type:complete len:159 (-) Transcript_37933:200-676(-)
MKPAKMKKPAPLPPVMPMPDTTAADIVAPPQQPVQQPPTQPEQPVVELPPLPPLPPLPEIPGFTAFGYELPGSAMSDRGRLSVPSSPLMSDIVFDDGKATIKDPNEDIFLIDKSQLPKPKISLVSQPTGFSQLSAENIMTPPTEEDETILAQLGNFAY